MAVLSLRLRRKVRVCLHECVRVRGGASHWPVWELVFIDSMTEASSSLLREK